MKKNVKIIIGANFGDEGKGLMTDYFASKAQNGIVIRFNGGAQAGHTVKTPDGLRHVFSHVGAGTFAGLPTYLSEYFIVNPLLFLDEYHKLINQGIIPKIFVDKQAKVTTPYEMMINQIVEIDRGENKHGSCGMGINETIVRHHIDDFSLFVHELNDSVSLKKKLTKIRDEYVSKRLMTLNIKTIPKDFTNALVSDALIDNFMMDVLEFLKSVEVSDIKCLANFDDLIFEGAQGLMLDEDYEYFPYVTHSKTGIKNPLAILENFKDYMPCDFSIEAIYVTRAYLTRHGAGPLFMELDEKPYAGVIDETNQPNQFQGTLRFAHLDFDRLKKTIKCDMLNNINYEINFKLSVTCLDQLDNFVSYIMENNVFEIEKEAFVSRLFAYMELREGYTSSSPDRNQIHFYCLN